MSRGVVVCRKGSISRSRTEECSVFDFEPSIQVRGVFKNHLRTLCGSARDISTPYLIYQQPSA